MHLIPTAQVDIFGTALQNSEKITFAVIAFCSFVIMLVLVAIGYKMFGSLNKIIDRLMKNLDDSEQRQRITVKYIKRIASEAKIQSTAAQGSQQAFLDGVKTLAETTSAPIIQAITETVPKVIQTELSSLQRMLSENPLHIGVMSVGSTGRIMAVNQDALTLFGWQPNEILGRFIFATDLNVIGPDQQRIIPTQYATSVSYYTKQPVANRLFGVYNKVKQTWVWVIVNSEPSFNPTTGQLERILTSYVEAGRVIPFDPKADYAMSLADTQEVMVITDDVLKAQPQ